MQRCRGKVYPAEDLPSAQALRGEQLTASQGLAGGLRGWDRVPGGGSLECWRWSPRGWLGPSGRLRGSE